MPSSSSRVIETAVRTFSDNADLKLAATKRLVKANVEHSEEAIARWDAVDAKKPASTRRWLPWGILALASALMWLADSREMIAYFQWVKFLRNPSPSERQRALAQAEQRTAAHLDARGKLLVLGDLTSRDFYKRKEKLWQSDPENPAYFADYAVIFQHRSLMPDFLQTARHLDPDNAWFTYLAAAAQGRNYEQPLNGRALTLLHEARTQTKYTSYKAELLRQRIRLLPQENLMERFESMLRVDNIHCSLDLHDLSQEIIFAAEETVKRGNVPAFQELAKDVDHLLSGIYQDEVSSLRDEESKADFAGMPRIFAESAEKLGLWEEAEKKRKIADDLWQRIDAVQPYEFTVDGKVANLRKVGGSIFGGPTGTVQWNVLKTPLPLTDADVKPGRLLDHEILSRFFNYICWLVMALGLGLAATYRFQVSKLSRRLAARMTVLLQPVDWAWIVGLGILLPFAFVMGINRLTPLGGREYGMKGTGMLMPAGHFLGLLVLWLVVPVQIIRWRLVKRAGGFGFSKPSLIGWVAVCCAVTFVPWIGWIAITDKFQYSAMEWMRFSMKYLITRLPWVFWPQIVLLGVPALWLCKLALRALSVRASRQFHQDAAARVLAVSWAAALGVLCIASQGFKAAERYWIARDELGRMDPARPAMSVYEYRTAAQLRKEMLNILNLPSIQK